MSIKLLPDSARLTVLGSGYSNTSIESGDGLTEDGKLWEDIAGNLDYDFGGDVDWDAIADEHPVDWSDVIYIGNDGTIYSDIEGTGTWESEDGKEYDGNGNAAMEETAFLESAGQLETMTSYENQYRRYSIPKNVLDNVRGGLVTEETNALVDHPERPHKYNPAVYYVQQDYDTAYLFLGEPFQHTTADGGNLSVSEDWVVVGPGNKKLVYYSSCSTSFTLVYEKMLASTDYNWVPIQYVCWQLLYGPFNENLLTLGENTITADRIIAGDHAFTTVEYYGKTYYKFVN